MSRISIQKVLTLSFLAFFCSHCPTIQHMLAQRFSTNRKSLSGLKHVMDLYLEVFVLIIFNFLLFILPSHVPDNSSYTFSTNRKSLACLINTSMSRISIQKILFQSALNDEQQRHLACIGQPCGRRQFACATVFYKQKCPNNQHFQYVKDLYSERIDVLDFVQLRDDNRSIVDVL